MQKASSVFVFVLILLWRDQTLLARFNPTTMSLKATLMLLIVFFVICLWRKWWTRPALVISEVSYVDASAQFVCSLMSVLTKSSDSVHEAKCVGLVISFNMISDLLSFWTCLICSFWLVLSNICWLMHLKWFDVEL